MHSSALVLCEEEREREGKKPNSKSDKPWGNEWWEGWTQRQTNVWVCVNCDKTIMHIVMNYVKQHKIVPWLVLLGTVTPTATGFHPQRQTQGLDIPHSSVTNANLFFFFKIHPDTLFPWKASTRSLICLVRCNNPQLLLSFQDSSYPRVWTCPPLWRTCHIDLYDLKSHVNIAEIKKSHVNIAAYTNLLCLCWQWTYQNLTCTQSYSHAKWFMVRNIIIIPWF